MIHMEELGFNFSSLRFCVNITPDVESALRECCIRERRPGIDLSHGRDRESLLKRMDFNC